MVWGRGWWFGGGVGGLGEGLVVWGRGWWFGGGVGGLGEGVFEGLKREGFRVGSWGFEGLVGVVLVEGLRASSSGVLCG